MGAESTNVVAKHATSKKRLQTLRTFGPIALVAVVGFQVWSVADLFQSIDQEQLVQKFEAKASKTLAPRVSESLSDVAEKLAPVFEREISNWSSDFAPKLDARLTQETEAIQASVTNHFDTAMTRALKSAEARQRAVLEKHIPGIEGDTEAQDRIIAQVQASAAKWGADTYHTTLHEHVVALDGIRKTLDTEYVAAGSAGIPQGSQVIGLWLELMGETVGGDDTLLAPEPQATEAKAQAPSPTPETQG